MRRKIRTDGFVQHASRILRSDSAGRYPIELGPLPAGLVAGTSYGMDDIIEHS
jgi:hypothetical protein